MKQNNRSIYLGSFRKIVYQNYAELLGAFPAQQQTRNQIISQSLQRRKDIKKQARLVKFLPQITLLLAALCGPFGTAHSLQDDKNKPINITATRLEVDEGLGAATYLGNVVMTQGSVHLTANSLTTQGNRKEGAQVLIAKGSPVTFRQQMNKNKGILRAEALRIEYDLKKNEMMLLGKAKIWQGKDRFFESEKIVYNRAKGTLKAGSSDTGVRAIIKQLTSHPKNKAQ